jgi:hypothetical protein
MGIAEEHLNMKQPQRPLSIAEPLRSRSVFDPQDTGVRCDVLYGPLTVDNVEMQDTVEMQLDPLL